MVRGEGEIGELLHGSFTDDGTNAIYSDAGGSVLGGEATGDGGHGTFATSVPYKERSRSGILLGLPALEEDEG